MEKRISSGAACELALWDAVWLLESNAEDIATTRYGETAARDAERDAMLALARRLAGEAARMSRHRQEA